MESFDKYLFHPSQMGKLMTEGRSKSDYWGETAKAYLLECWINKTYGRFKDFTNKYMEKGTLAEEDSIDLYSIVKKKFYAKNKDLIMNEYFIGTPDLFEGDSIYKSDIIVDLKTSWDIFTFYTVFVKPLNKDYLYQLQAYMDMTGAKQARLAYCLVNTPIHLIEDEKKKTFWRMGVIDAENDQAYIQACDQIEKNGNYDEIPMSDRIIEFVIDRDQEIIDKMHDRVIEGRKFLNELHEITEEKTIFKTK